MAIRLRDVSKRFGRLWALARLSCDIPAGAAVLLTGENGAGKTTFLRIVATALQPSFGEVELFSKVASRNLEAVRARLILLTHHNHLYESLTAVENLRLTERLRGRVEGAAVGATLQSVLQRVGLAPHAQRQVANFSAGMRRRLCIARLLLQRPELVLLDEPFSQLDPEGVELMQDIVLELRQAGTTVIMATHDVERGMALCDTRLTLTAGRLLHPLQTLTAS